jgi:hypothetical protein
MWACIMRQWHWQAAQQQGVMQQLMVMHCHAQHALQRLQVAALSSRLQLCSKCTVSLCQHEALHSLHFISLQE